MPNIAKLLREEVQRLARKEVRQEMAALKKEQVRQKKLVAQLRKDVSSLQKRNKRLSKRVEPVIEEVQDEQAAEQAERIRPTSASIKRLRNKLGLTQTEFGKLVGVTTQSVNNWENKGGRLRRLRKETLKNLADVMTIGAREARRRLDENA